MKTLLGAVIIVWLAAGPPVFAISKTPVLARVELKDSWTQFPLPVHALLRDVAGRDYALALATASQLRQTHWPYSILDHQPDVARYVVALPMRKGAREAASGQFDVRHDDGVQWLIRLRSEAEVETLSELGFALMRLSAEPLVLESPARFSAMTLAPFASNVWIAAMMSRINSNDLVSLVSQLTGEEPVPASGELRVATSRHTRSGASVRKATEFGYEFFRALGLAPVYQAWTNGINTNVNVIGTQVGMTIPNEEVLIVAHLDDEPSSGRAPGADDNASGSVGVLTAAAVLSQWRFDRTVRYALFTGEEQGLLGSAVYANAAYAAGNNIVAVLNLDMIAWDSANGPTLNLFTRTTSNPNYSKDLLIASTFTNVVATYGLQNRLTPFVLATGMGQSDHVSFWNKGYGAILAIEDYQNGDFNAYYHTANDSLANININYFTAFAQAAVGTVAHLAEPVEPRPFDVVRVISGDWSATNSSFGASLLHAVHTSGAEETTDVFDTTYASLPANTNNAWPVIVTQPGDDDLSTDCRDATSQSIFRGDLIMSSPYGTPVSCTNRLRFVFLNPPATNRIYTVRITVDSQYTQSGTGFLCVTNVRSLVAGDGFIALPPLANVTNGAVYGTCDLAARFIDVDTGRNTLRIGSISATQVVLEANTQIGTRTFNEVAASTNLVPLNAWTWIGAFTNSVAPTASNFEEGWERVPLAVGVSAFTNSPSLFFRLRRSWFAP